MHPLHVNIINRCSVATKSKETRNKILAQEFNPDYFLVHNFSKLVASYDQPKVGVKL